MTSKRPDFQKKEMAISSTPYVYLPVDIPVYTVEVTHRDEIDGGLLQKALERTIRRMPYLSDTLVIEDGAIYYAENPLPMEVARFVGPRPVGGSETNYHMLDLTWDGNRTWFSMFHGFCDGQGVNTFLESVLYHYYCMKDGTEYDAAGIRSDSTQGTEAETVDPYDRQYSLSPDFTMPERKQQPEPYHLPEIIPNPAGDVLEYGFRLPSEAFMRFVKENGTSPAAMLSILMGEAVMRLHPDADKPIMAIMPVSIRRMLECEETFKNCSNRIILPVRGTPMDALPFAQRAAQLRGIMKQQMNPDIFRAICNMVGGMNRKRMTEATDYMEEVNKPAAFNTLSHDTFYIDYIGSMHKTAYSDRITDIRFLCKPAAGRTLHINVIENNGQFCLAMLACSDVSVVADALEQVLRDFGLPVERTPESSFSLPLTCWREGMI
ncbi:MAG: hypothetical protein J6U01_12625 [Clostridia bacterium]|nr:hypothetical protein [Clostridia bacterium]